MKVFTTLRNKIREHKKLSFAVDVAFFLGCMLLLYFYLLYANLSTAPEFIYSQF